MSDDANASENSATYRHHREREELPVSNQPASASANRKRYGRSNDRTRAHGDELLDVKAVSRDSIVFSDQLTLAGTRCPTLVGRSRRSPIARALTGASPH